MTALTTKTSRSISFQESPALATASRLHRDADLFNRALFVGQFPSTMLRLQNKKGCDEYYSLNRFIKADLWELDCITLNSSTEIDRPLIELISPLSHKRFHQHVWAIVNHKTTTGGSCPEWRAEMQPLVLPPIRVGTTWSGPTTHFIEPGGLFARCFRRHAEEVEAITGV